MGREFSQSEDKNHNNNTDSNIVCQFTNGLQVESEVRVAVVYVDLCRRLFKMIHTTKEQQSRDSLSYQDKSLDIRTRLGLWREERSKKTNLKEEKARWNVSTRIEKKNDSCVSNYPSTTPKSTSKKTPCSKKIMDDVPMRARLELWLKEKGKTPLNERMANKLDTVRRRKTFAGKTLPTQCFSTGKKRSSHRGILKQSSARKARKNCTWIDGEKENNIQVDIFHGTRTSPLQANVVDQDNNLCQRLEECFGMIQKGKFEEVVFVLDDIQRDYPNALRNALYWICRAKVSENAEDHDRVVCMFEQAFAFSAQPEQEVKNAYDEYIAKKQKTENDKMCRTPHKTPSRELAKLNGDVFTSSVVRFCLMDSTPYRNRKRCSSEKRVLTPVRRTTRWERCGINRPQIIEEKNMTVASLDELTTNLKSNLVFKPNSLLPCELGEEFSALNDITEVY